MPRASTWAPPSARMVVISLCALVFLNVLDAFATIEIISRGGEEGNPIIQPLFKIGSLGFFLYKMGLVLSCATMLAWLSRTHRFAWRMLCLANGVYCALAGLHVYLLIFV